MAENTWFPNRTQASVRLHTVDGFGRAIDPLVLNVAQSIAARAIPYAETLIRDTALATSLLEESAATVSCVIRKRAQLQKPAIVNKCRIGVHYRTDRRKIIPKRDPDLVIASRLESGADAHVTLQSAGKRQLRRFCMVSVRSF